MNYVSQENLDNIVKGLSNKIVMSVSNGALIGDTTPVGTVISFMGTQAPLYYLVCDGTTYNIAEYQELADFIEAQFGAVNYFGGDGVDTFAVPDLRGEFLRGSGVNSYENQGNGANVGVHQDGTKVIEPVIEADNSVAFYYDATNQIHLGVENVDRLHIQPPSSGRKYSNTLGVRGTDSSNSGAYYTSRPTNTSVLYCIKYTKAVIPSEYEDGTPVGRVIFDSILREGYIKANGAQIEDASIAIPRLLSFVQKYSSQLIAPDQATYEANVGLYLYDSNNDILTLPNYIGRFLEGGNSVTSIEAGLPNIKGNIVTHMVQGATYGIILAGGTYGEAFSTVKDETGIGTFTPSGTNSYRNMIHLDASTYSSVYNDNITTVQPSSITLIPQIRY